jgi:hypothetical protein
MSSIDPRFIDAKFQPDYIFGSILIFGAVAFSK